jgi:hypothetical protein
VILSINVNLVLVHETQYMLLECARALPRNERSNVTVRSYSARTNDSQRIDTDTYNRAC